MANEKVGNRELEIAFYLKSIPSHDELIRSNARTDRDD